MFLPFHYTVQWDLLSSDTCTASREIPVREFCRLEDLDLGVETTGQEWMQADEARQLAISGRVGYASLPCTHSLVLLRFHHDGIFGPMGWQEIAVSVRQGNLIRG